MNQDPLPQLPLGTQRFEALQICVDKTDLIGELASCRGKFFLARPNGFGKTLLLSTFEALFRNGLRDFRGLAIERLWEEEWPSSVVKLDFSKIQGFSDFSAFKAGLTALVADAFGAAGFAYDPGSRKPLWTQLSSWFKTLPANSLVLLIDDYDAPVTASLGNTGLLRLVNLELATFYAVVKSNDRPFRFFFMTGVTSFDKSIFSSELNHLSDLSLDTRYGTLLGFTKSEVENAFAGHLERAGRSLGLGRETLLAELERHYGGFCFDRRAGTRVWCPWSVLHFLEAPQKGFLPYWMERPALRPCLTSAMFRSPESFTRPKSIALSAFWGAPDSDEVFLTQAGCLTIQRVADSTAFLDYPNAEVRTVLARHVMKNVLGGKTLEQAGGAGVVQMLGAESPEKVVGLLNRLLASVEGLEDEASLRALVQTCLTEAGLLPKVEERGSALETGVGGRRWVFVFRVKRAEQDSEVRLREALGAVEKREDGKAPETRDLVRLALFFSPEERAFVRWSAAV